MRDLIPPLPSLRRSYSRVRLRNEGASLVTALWVGRASVDKHGRLDRREGLRHGIRPEKHHLSVETEDRGGIGARGRPLSSEDFQLAIGRDDVAIPWGADYNLGLRGCVAEIRCREQAERAPISFKRCVAVLDGDVAGSRERSRRHPL